MPFALGIDLGTTSVKAVALDAGARAVATASAGHDLDTPRPGWAEADPVAWWDNVVRVTRAIGERVPLVEVAVVGVSGMVPALILLGADGQVLRPSIQQNDGRTGEELAVLAGRLDTEAFFAATGQPWSQQLVPPRLLWLRRHEPDVYRRIRRVLGSYDYVAWRLTGASCLEQNWALEAGLWEATDRRWHQPMLEGAEIPGDWLAPVRAPHEVIGGVTAAAAAATGLAPGTPLIAGSADHVAAALAAGAGPGELVLKIGGAGDVLYGLDRFAPDPRLYIDYHDLPGAFLLNGCMATSGSLVKWLAAECARDLGAGGDVYARLDAEAAGVPAGSDGLVVLPYFLGEKTPLLDPDARGVFFGLTLSHGRGHLHRAVLEAVAHGFRHHVEILEAAGHPIHAVRVMDGGARSPLWRQIIADVLGRDIAYAPGAELGSAHGTAWLAGAAHGFWPWRDLPAPRDGLITHTPDPSASARYQPLYAIYRNLYTHLREDFTALRHTI
ncbi:MAG TPA: FGGY family carbohydrate kinase [Candidatus Limnocylindrales bacterium]|nr:FGGY family carbohydrate kinase [Candidatus Limnocylindrales bacterium]